MASRQNKTDFSLLATHIGRNVLIVEDEFVVANDLEIILEKAEYQVTGIASSVQEAVELIATQKPDVVLLDIVLQGQQTGIDLAAQLSMMSIPFIYLSANSNQSIVEAAKATHPYGFLVKPFREKDVLITLQMALYRHAHSVETYLRKEQTLQIALSDTFSLPGEWKQKFLQAAQLFQTFIPFDFLLAGIITDQEAYSLSGFFRIGFEEYQCIGMSDLSQMSGFSLEKINDLLASYPHMAAGLYNGDAFRALSHSYPFPQLLAKTFRLESNLILPLQLTQGGIFIFSFFSRQAHVFSSRHLSLLEHLKNPLTLTLDRLLAFEQIEKLKEKLEQENHYLQEQVKTSANFEEMVGASRSLLSVFDQVTQVACTDTSVLILGESGTGKELIARSIHNLSSRKSKLLVKVNCAALPAHLIESELFGHEKGAFTGAIDKRIGKFELAHQGSIFLDEIGEMPLELQAKLLRVLQEKEIERLGGRGPIKTDVRIIAATNRNLEKEVAEGRFRLDLYYRLNVFPIALPALRDRSEDIPLLASFFAQKLCKKIGKQFYGITEKAMGELLHYQWPGNIRELENIIEQAVIINDGQSPLDLGRPLINKISISDQSIPPALGAPKTLSDVKLLQQETEREYILSVLKKANGRIRGKNGAAELLNLKPTTLESRMEKLGIRKVDI
ncbi:sigma 54-interacting transcriptional regulator [Cytophagaceae bacterium YF14B1]|uniref:Sigma 54-interacting transcriptional regulator n=1 Tax=Xanthocytophaga flava TaxID=3048013 RepID=A0AAE3QKA5_9BACT|nr:sigma 54-interacting transcriptional regulator [Xanthocytophaga flavus]MDJ1480937.1 sigma 54-interacting transcriptional regulator [Xanthocytophaga flavus]